MASWGKIIKSIFKTSNSKKSNSTSSGKKVTKSSFSNTYSSNKKNTGVEQNTNKQAALTKTTKVEQKNNITTTVTNTPNSVPKIDINELIKNKQKYLNLKSNIEIAIKKLNNVISNLEIPANRIKDLYSIDSVGIDQNSLKNIMNDLMKEKEYLSNVLLIEIEQKIKGINESIG